MCLELKHSMIEDTCSEPLNLPGENYILSAIGFLDYDIRRNGLDS